MSDEPTHISRFYDDPELQRRFMQFALSLQDLVERAVAKELRGLGLEPKYRGMSVYFIQAESGGSIKIGVAQKPEKRLAELQTASPNRLVLLGTIPGDQRVERELHERFAESRMHGEWFDDSELLRDFIREHVNGTKEAAA